MGQSQLASLATRSAISCARACAGSLPGTQSGACAGRFLCWRNAAAVLGVLGWLGIAAPTHAGDAQPEDAKAGEAQLKYGGYFAGARIGEAEINVRLSDDNYVIAGEAWTTGIVNTATRWRSEFSASGQIRNGEAVPSAYRFNTSGRGDRSRTTEIADGKVETFRNGRSRDKTEAPVGLDVLSALFFPGDCKDLDELHTGTSIYTLTLIKHDVPKPGSADYAEACEFDVVDDEGDDYRIAVKMAEFNGHRIPCAWRWVAFSAAVRGC